MQPFVNIKQHNIALLFCNYLLSLGFSAKVTETDAGFDIYCQHEKLAEVQQLFEEFIRHPHDQKYQQAAWEQGNTHQLVDDSPSIIQQFSQQFMRHAGLVTLVIFATCWLVFLSTYFIWGVKVFHLLKFPPVFSITEFLSEPWRLLGPAFFHFSWMHLIFNTMWWWQLGGDIEKKLGKGTLINIFLITALVSNVGQFLVAGANFGGLSGVVYGLVGFVWWIGWLAPQYEIKLAKPVVGILLFWMLLGFVDLLPINMANTAHFMGLVSGCCLAWLYVFKRKV